MSICPEPAKAPGVKVSAALLTRIDDALGDVVEKDPSKTSDSSPKGPRLIRLR
jgi:hypothetical protein